MDNLDKSLQELKSFAELQSFSRDQHRTIVELTKQLVALQDETQELKLLLEGTVPLFGAERIIVTNEEMICLKQIEDLRKISDMAVLTLDQTRQLDLLIKNLHSIRTNSKNILPASFKNADDTKLLELAK